MTLRLQPTLNGELEITVLDTDGLSDAAIEEALAQLLLDVADEYERTGRKFDASTNEACDL